MKKRVDKGILIPFLGLIIVFLVISVFEYTTQSVPQQSEKLSPEVSNLQQSADEEPKNQEDNQADVVSEGGSKEDSIGGGGSAGGGGGGGGGGSEGSESTSPEEIESLPTDLYTAPCGSYFEKYGVCAGSCPEGECINEGRSCYCKIISK